MEKIVRGKVENTDRIEKGRDFFIALLCSIAGIAIIVGIIALLVFVIFPIGRYLTVEVAWAFTIYMCLMIFFIRRELKKNPRHNLFKHFVLYFFFPIWLTVWMCCTTDYLNILHVEKQRKPVMTFFLWVFVPFYSVYWTYQTAKRIDILAARKGIKSDLGIVCLVLSLLTGTFIPSILIQHKINTT